MYEFLGITLALATLLTVNAVATAAAAGLWHLCKRPLMRCSARTRAELLFVMRMGPPVIAIIWIAAFMIPSYLVYEPYGTNEFVSKKLGVLAAISAVGVGCAIWRGIRSWLATRSLLDNWLANATPIQLDDLNVPAFMLSHSFPIIAVVGTLRPRLFIAEHVLQSLTSEELAAAVAHEYGHMSAQDNFKRSMLRASRAALLIIPCGRSLDRAWGEASESAADEHAAQLSSSVALNLASALVRIARLIPADEQPVMPSSAFLVGGEETRGVKGRVRRLVELASTDPGLLVTSAPLFRLTPWFILIAIVALGLTIESRPSVLATVHSLIEHIVVVLS
ncbi:MAG TPA: M56 family metallopeptidase [Pyrinomonadaceae bacterium]|nr:M56 family metallopeptidase [Pyrinomonadaceae bacterium]